MDPLKNEIHPDMVKVWKVRCNRRRDWYSCHFSLPFPHDKV